MTFFCIIPLMIILSLSHIFFGLDRPKTVQVDSELAITQQVELNPMKSKSKNLLDNKGFSRF